MRTAHIDEGSARLEGDLLVPPDARGLVIFAHGSGSSRFSTRNRQVAGFLNDNGYATLLLDLLTRQEEAIDIQTSEFRFDVQRLGRRLVAAADWAASESAVRDLRIGFFGASTGAAAALIAAAERPEVAAVVSRGGRPDLADRALEHVQAPTLLIVGGSDEPVIGLNRDAMRRMHAEVRLEVVPGATHLFEEPGALETVSHLAAEWFGRHLADGAPPDDTEPFLDRSEAGRVLAGRLRSYARRGDAIVLALPRGGVPVAFEVAAALGLPLDVFLVRKLGTPGHRELAMGAIASGGVRVLNEDVIRALRIPREQIDRVAREEEQELTRREVSYRGDRQTPVEGKVVILVDDGLATGSSMRAAVQAIRQRDPARIVVAVPIGARDTCRDLESLADEVVCARTPEPFSAVGLWYRDFAQTSDEEVRALLRAASEHAHSR
jgi:predicted phosphoribosyltransferase/dienelactone hydrolase